MQAIHRNPDVLRRPFDPQISTPAALRSNVCTMLSVYLALPSVVIFWAILVWNGTSSKKLIRSQVSIRQEVVGLQSGHVEEQDFNVVVHGWEDVPWQ